MSTGRRLGTSGCPICSGVSCFLLLNPFQHEAIKNFIIIILFSGILLVRTQCPSSSTGRLLDASGSSTVTLRDLRSCDGRGEVRKAECSYIGLVSST